MGTDRARQKQRKLRVPRLQKAGRRFSGPDPWTLGERDEGAGIKTHVLETLETLCPIGRLSSCSRYKVPNTRRNVKGMQELGGKDVLLGRIGPVS